MATRPCPPFLVFTDGTAPIICGDYEHPRDSANSRCNGAGGGSTEALSGPGRGGGPISSHFCVGQLCGPASPDPHTAGVCWTPTNRPRCTHRPDTAALDPSPPFTPFGFPPPPVSLLFFVVRSGRAAAARKGSRCRPLTSARRRTLTRTPTPTSTSPTRMTSTTALGRPRDTSESAQRSEWCPSRCVWSPQCSSTPQVQPIVSSCVPAAVCLQRAYGTAAALALRFHRGRGSWVGRLGLHCAGSVRSVGGM